MADPREALWSDPAPTTEAGRYLWRLFSARSRSGRPAIATGKPWALYLPAGAADPFAEPGVPQPIPVAPGQVEAGL